MSYNKVVVGNLCLGHVVAIFIWYFCMSLPLRNYSRVECELVEYFFQNNYIGIISR